MTGSLTAVLAVLVATAAILIAEALLGFSLITRLVFRNRLANIRIACYRAIADGRIRRTAETDEFLANLDRAVSEPGWLRPVRMLAACRATIELRMVPPCARYADLPPASRRLMLDFERRVAVAFASYLTWATPAGWFRGPGRLPRGMPAVRGHRDVLPAAAHHALLAEIAAPTR
jgi:hypothetical protein